MKQKLIETLQGKELELKEIYLAMPEAKKASIRATLNLSVKKGLIFERIGKGKYRLKQ
jgi:predicted transcriptional regulator of viral defense system